MKNLVVIALTLFSLNSIGQTINYSDLSGDKPVGTFTKYISKNGETYSVGDTLIIGVPSGANGNFVYISNRDIMGTAYVVAPEQRNTKAELKKMRVVGSKRSGWKVSFQTKGMSVVDNYFFNIEDAIASGEIIGKGMTSDEALAELKKAKDKLDLGLITQEEYEEIKADLVKYIK